MCPNEFRNRTLNSSAGVHLLLKRLSAFFLSPGLDQIMKGIQRQLAPGLAGGTAVRAKEGASQALFAKEDVDVHTIINSNRFLWQAAGITRIRHHRWPIEVYHQEGKAEGLDQYQMRDFQAISRHIGLVAVTYSLLCAAPHDPALLHKLQRQLKCDLDGSVPSWQRITQAQSLWNLASFIALGLAQGHALDDMLAPLLAAVCA